MRLEGHGERHGRMLWPHRREERLGVDRIREGHEEGTGLELAAVGNNERHEGIYEDGFNSLS